MEKKIKVTFMPGAFDEFEGTQEDLDNLIKEIEQLAQSGELFKGPNIFDVEDLEEDFELRDSLELLIESRNRKLN